MDGSGIAVGSAIGAAAVAVIVLGLFIAPPESIKQSTIIDESQITIKEEKQKISRQILIQQNYHLLKFLRNQNQE